jgi:hypothetical protein
LDVNQRGRIFSLLLALALLPLALFNACSEGNAPKPDLPTSVSPGWTLQRMNPSPAPEGLPPSDPPPLCWKADYAAESTASVWVCGYRISGSAFNAAQRLPSSGNAIKFQQGRYLIAVQWNNVSQTAIRALIVAIQKSVPAT